MYLTQFTKFGSYAKNISNKFKPSVACRKLCLTKEQFTKELRTPHEVNPKPVGVQRIDFKDSIKAISVCSLKNI